MRRRGQVEEKTDQAPDAGLHKERMRQELPNAKRVKKRKNVKNGRYWRKTVKNDDGPSF